MHKYLRKCPVCPYVFPPKKPYKKPYIQHPNKCKFTISRNHIWKNDRVIVDNHIDRGRSMPKCVACGMINDIGI